ncbi:MAG: putative signaling protein [Chroococcidiopsis sp. SAG 2025]|uniref:EAL domain-containing protein n=1 Tax=Chroococcidiopsis sp. SAG 2025 TaxID=171389 RepID=UPI002936DC33|nr:EAL domain-containing protein [Chroococcidiopsis sp. SAG 2025]MDV2990879.1 putative signaling protein [Chroococcidiopsis sp. SAG 2025]
MAGSSAAKISAASMVDREIIQISRALSATYDLRVVFLSLAIAIFGAYTALDLVGQVIYARGIARKFWTVGGAIALGISVWAMHFVAMLAYQLPIPISYNFEIVLLSMVVAIAFAGLGLFLVSRLPLKWLLLASGSFFVGLATIGMHYTAMHAMLVAAEPTYDLRFVAFSNLCALCLSFCGLWLTFHPTAKVLVPAESWRKLGSAILAGTAIDGMHYLAMAGVNFYPSVQKLSTMPAGIDNYVLAITIGVATLAILLLGGLASFFGQQLRAEIARVEAIRESEKRYQELFELAPDAYFSLTPDGTIQSANQFSAEYLGYSQEELIGNSAWMTVYEADLPWAQQWMESMFRDRVTTSEIELRKVRKDGSVFWIRERSKLILDAMGTPVGLNTICRDITQLKQVEEQLRQNAFHDPLTGLPNRVLFMDRLQLAIEHHKRHPEDFFAVLFLDLNRFKVINDSLGHLLGDRLLKAIGDRLKECLRPIDTVARLGGDEFTILIEDITDVSDAIRVAERVNTALAVPFHLDGQEVFTAASIGIALSSTGYDNSEDVLRDADLAMYRAKSQGTSSYQIFNPEMHARAVALLQLETDLRNAVERQEFRLYYQPIISLATGRIVGFEALIRWQHPQYGLQNPSQFIHAAEEAGLINRMCQWVLYTACAQLAQWQRQFPAIAPLTMSVNISGKQFSQPQLSQQVQQALQDTELSAECLHLEITEGAIMDGAGAAPDLLWQLRNLGVQLWIDDFGTGYSSLGRLYHFPIHGLKVDRSFVTQIESADNAPLVETILTLARQLELEVTAEGVETATQLTRLRALQSEYAQGYFFSPAVDGEAATALLSQNLQW